MSLHCASLRHQLCFVAPASAGRALGHKVADGSGRSLSVVTRGAAGPPRRCRHRHRAEDASRPAAATAAGPWLALAAAAAMALAAPNAHALDAAATFTKSCAGCHTGGGNIIRRDATLQLGDLEKNGLADTQALYRIIYSGKGSMPGFGKECAPRGQCTFGPRLADEDIEALADFVLSSAQQGWVQQQ